MFNDRIVRPAVNTNPDRCIVGFSRVSLCIFIYYCSFFEKLSWVWGPKYCIPAIMISHSLLKLQAYDNDNDNELRIYTKSNENHHKCNINKTYKNTKITTVVPRRLH